MKEFRKASEQWGTSVKGKFVTTTHARGQNERMNDRRVGTKINVQASEEMGGKGNSFELFESRTCSKDDAPRVRETAKDERNKRLR